MAECTDGVLLFREDFGGNSPDRGDGRTPDHLSANAPAPAENRVFRVNSFVRFKCFSPLLRP